MTVSGSTTFNLSGNAICAQALRVIRQLGRDETLTAGTNRETQALIALNAMVKTDQARLGLWRKREAKLFVVPSQAKYSLPGANAADVADISETTLDAAEAAAETVLSVTSTSNGPGFANADIIGIVLDDDTIQWTTISSFVADDTVTIATGLTAAAASGSKVFAYTPADAIPRPQKIESVRRENGDQEIEIFHLSRDDYFMLPNKGSLGTPVQWYYDPQRGTGVLYLWSTPDTVDDEVNFTYLDELEVFTTGSTADYPQEWMEYLIFGLAMRLATMNGATLSTEALAIYTNAISSLEEWDSDDASVVFSFCR